MDCVAIVGVGLLGGSFARALRQHGFSGRILGVSSAATLRAALDLAVIDEGLPLELALPRADLVFLAQPIAQIVEILPRLDPHLRPGALVTDVGSTKRAIVSAGDEGIQRGVFLGGHPMAGKELAGVQNSDARLFENSTWFLTPSGRDMLDRPPASEFVEWIVRIGAAPVPIAADQHDELVAFTSHLPQLLSTTLAALIQETIGLTKARVAAGRGLLDMTRLAESDYRIWKDIIATNPDRIVDALDAYLRRLSALRDEIQTVPLSGGAASPDVAREFGAAHDFSKPLRKANT
jgi:prephenate dehydrogenase